MRGTDTWRDRYGGGEMQGQRDRDRGMGDRQRGR